MAPKGRLGKRARTQRVDESAEQVPKTPEDSGPRTPTLQAAQHHSGGGSPPGSPPIKQEEADEAEETVAQETLAQNAAPPPAVVQPDALATRRPRNADEELNLAVDKIQEKVAKLPTGERKPDLALLKSSSTPGQLSALWMRLSDARGREDISVRKAWDMLCEMSSGSVNK